MRPVTETDLPTASALQSWRAGSDFFDAYRAPLADPTLTPAEIFIRVTRAMPAWVSTLMAIRNAIVRRFGLKAVGRRAGGNQPAAADCRIGQRLGIFDVFGESENELVLGIDDRHLDFRVSVLKPAGDQPRSYVISTVVKVHNRLGRAYMAPVGRIHPLVVKSLMKRTPV
jgi:Protein of unknown function (DUF2867)